jgi:hypothetical protein
MLPSDTDLLQEINSLVGRLVRPSLSSISRGNDLFEAFLFALAIDAARSVGATVTFEDASETTTRTLILRTSPGRIYAMSPSYVHAVLGFPHVPPLEVHVGIFIAGRSTVPHEADLCVLEKREAQRCRLQGVHPRSSKVRLSVEAKFYGSPLGIRLVREFAGLCSDLSAGNSSFVSNTTAENVARFMSHRFGVGAFHPGVKPGSRAAGDFRSHVRQLLRRYQEQ